MLTLTENARSILNSLTEQPGAEEMNALRISAEGGAQPAFVVAPAGRPEADDLVVEEGGATVYLDPPAAERLGDKVLDAGVDESGNVQFALGVQGDDGSA